MVTIKNCRARSENANLSFHFQCFPLLSLYGLLFPGYASFQTILFDKKIFQKGKLKLSELTRREFSERI